MKIGIIVAKGEAKIIGLVIKGSVVVTALADLGKAQQREEYKTKNN